MAKNDKTIIAKNGGGVNALTVEAKFKPGGVFATPGLLSEVDAWDAAVGFARHVSGDWGEVCDEDRKANDWSLVNGARLLSAYTSSKGVRFWIITEADRSSTTLLLPEEY